MFNFFDDLLLIPREDGDANIAFVIEERAYEQATEELLGVVREGGDNAGFASQLLLLLYASTIETRIEAPPSLSRYVADVLFKVGALRTPEKDNQVARSMNILPAFPKKGRPLKITERYLTDMRRSAAFFAARPAATSHLEALELAAERCFCDRRTVERSISRLGYSGRPPLFVPV